MTSSHLGVKWSFGVPDVLGLIPLKFRGFGTFLENFKEFIPWGYLWEVVSLLNHPLLSVFTRAQAEFSYFFQKSSI